MDDKKAVVPASEKAKALAAALAQIEKQFGKGSVMRMDANAPIEDVQVVSTGSLGLDIALGVGGLPRGRVVEIYGPESSGKTTLTLQTIAEMQKLGGTCAFIDAEHALDVGYAQKLGVNLHELLISQPDTGGGGCGAGAGLPVGRVSVDLPQVVPESHSAEGHQPELPDAGGAQGGHRQAYRFA